MQPTVKTFVPLLTLHSDQVGGPDDPDAAVRDEFTTDLALVYAAGPHFDGPPITWQDLHELALTHRSLRRQAADHLDAMLDSVQLHGSSPALMVSFHGIESSLLAADRFWATLAVHRAFADLAVDVPGDLVVGVPARDVLIVTGSRSPTGLAKARRCVERMFFAGGDHLLTRDLLVWRDTGWEPFREEPESTESADSWSAPDSEVVPPDPPAEYESGPPPLTTEDWPVPPHRPGRARYA